MAFDPKRHVIKVQGGREYLPVSARLRWFREEHPDWGIVTTAVEINLEKQYAIFSATIFNDEGKVMATATKMENVKGFGDYMEKAETGSVGRALAFCGYGTQYATELDDNSVRLNDAPRGGFGTRPNTAGGNGGGYNSAGNGGGYAGGAPRPNGMGPGMPPRPMPTAAPVAREVAPPAEEYDPEEELQDAAPVLPAGIRKGMDGIRPNGNGAARPLTSDAPPPAMNRPAPAGAPVTRVREPEAEYADPGGDDEDMDGEDPFGEEPTPAAPARPLARAAANVEEASSNRCSVSGCNNVLTASQLTMSNNKYGKPICLIHQRDMAPPVEAGAKRPAAKALL